MGHETRSKEKYAPTLYMKKKQSALEIITDTYNKHPTRVLLN